MTNSALGLRAKHPLLIAALEKVMIMIERIMAIRIEMNIENNNATVKRPLFGLSVKRPSFFPVPMMNIRKMNIVHRIAHTIIY